MASIKPGKRILVTGAAGFVGCHVASILARRGCEIYGVRSAGDEAPFEGQIAWAVGDLLDSAFRSAVVGEARASHLIHLAWDMTDIYSERHEDWVEASSDLFWRFRKAGGRRIVAAGSCAEYGPYDGHCSETDTPKDPTSPYGRAKVATYDALNEIADHAMSFAWGRPFMMYGPFENPRRLVAHVVNSLLDSVSARCSHGKQVRDFLHVHDVARAFVKLVDAEITGAVNIGSGKPVSLKTLVRKIGRKLDGLPLIELGAIEARPDEPERVVADIDRLRNEVAWSPKFNLESGLDHTIQWWRERRGKFRSSNRA